jgi:hypothetical protein
MALGSSQPLTEMSTRNLPGGMKVRPACRADNLTAICWADCLENIKASTSHNSMGLHGLLQIYLYLFFLHYDNHKFRFTSHLPPLIAEHISECQYGWEYDRRWFSRTAPSQENWVCDKSLYVTNTFVTTQIGEAVGTISFGHMSDT